MQSYDVVIVIPFFDEQELIERLLDSLARNKGAERSLLIGVDHKSSDRSVEIMQAFSRRFAQILIVGERSDIRCGGVPRSKGFKRALEIVKNKSVVPIATIDADSTVSPHFISEIIKMVPYQADVLGFPVRHNQMILQQWAASQRTSLQRKTVHHALIGLDFIKYQLAYTLALHGAVETRGPAGYAISSAVLRKLRHVQPLNSLGQPVTGENNQLGIRAHREGYRLKMSQYVNSVSPRREFFTLNSSQEKKYGKDSSGAEIFTLARGSDFPQLSTRRWELYLRNGVRQSVAALLTRAYAYGILEKFYYVFDDSHWEEIINIYQNIASSHKPTRRERDILGSAIYKKNFGRVVRTIKPKKFNLFCQRIEEMIPPEPSLMRWSQSRKLMIKPSPFVVPKA